MSPTVIQSADFVFDATQLILQEARRAIAAQGFFRLGLCGGGTPRPVYAALAASDLDWSKVFLIFGDERCVPPDDAQSNFRMVRLALLDHAPIPPANVLRIKSELPPEEAAADYEAQLAGLAQSLGLPVPGHDLLLLGLGDDGHTASLFPGTNALDVTDRLCVANFVPKLDVWRLTLTYSALNASRHTVFLVNDPKKSAVVDQVLRGEGDHPAARIAPRASAPLTWLLGPGQ